MHTQSLYRLLLLGALFSFTRAAFGQSADIAIVHVTIINPSAGKPQPDMTIVIRSRNIVSVAPSKDLKLSPSANVINGTGKFAIPGLWDMLSGSRAFKKPTSAEKMAATVTEDPPPISQPNISSNWTPIGAKRKRATSSFAEA